MEGLIFRCNNIRHIFTILAFYTDEAVHLDSFPFFNLLIGEVVIQLDNLNIINMKNDFTYNFFSIFFGYFTLYDYFSIFHNIVYR